MEREQEKFSGEWAGTTRPSNQSQDYSALRVWKHTVAACVLSSPPLFLSFSWSNSNTAALVHHDVASPFLSSTSASSPSSTVSSSASLPRVPFPRLLIPSYSTLGSRLSSFSRSRACLLPASSCYSSFYAASVSVRTFCSSSKGPGTDRFLAVFLSRLRA